MARESNFSFLLKKNKLVKYGLSPGLKIFNKLMHVYENKNQNKTDHLTETSESKSWPHQDKWAVK